MFPLFKNPQEKKIVTKKDGIRIVQEAAENFMDEHEAEYRKIILDAGRTPAEADEIIEEMKEELPIDAIKIFLKKADEKDKQESLKEESEDENVSLSIK